MNKPFDSIVILGPTASGKTKLAVQLAAYFNSMVVSADSRQVYKELNIGSGKDLAEYELPNKKIPYRLINCCSLEQEFTLVDFIKAHQLVKEETTKNGSIPVICGGSGMYLESMLKPFNLYDSAVDKAHRKHLETLTVEQLKKMAQKQQVQFDALSITKYQLIRKIEHKQYAAEPLKMEPFKPIVFGLDLPAKQRWQHIEIRLNNRFQEGMLAEVENLLLAGVNPERLKRLGLEYKYLVLYLQNEMGFDDMKHQLYIEIRKYAKRQMTYFRKMERDGLKINWLNAQLDQKKLFETCITFLV